MTNETRTRFLAAIAAQLPADRIAEVHLFPAIRQGGMESGVAVIAVEPVGAAGADTADARGSDAEQESALEFEHRESAPADEAETFDADDADAFDADDSETLDDDDPEVLDADTTPRPTPRRYTVFSARYRHTLKGPDRGKWETSVTEEADAPLLTVDAVVRGVQRRSGDVDEIVRLSGDEVRAELPAPA